MAEFQREGAQRGQVPLLLGRIRRQQQEDPRPQPFAAVTNHAPFISGFDKNTETRTQNSRPCSLGEENLEVARQGR